VGTPEKVLSSLEFTHQRIVAAGTARLAPSRRDIVRQVAEQDLQQRTVRLQVVEEPVPHIGMFPLRERQRRRVQTVDHDQDIQRRAERVVVDIGVQDLPRSTGYP